uniref:Uncharacterized protein n=1 Tax=Cacopsylla melanoneura TaxID=428564 RepID=A0A8D8ZDQ6_9HEMI
MVFISFVNILNLYLFLSLLLLLNSIFIKLLSCSITFLSLIIVVFKIKSQDRIDILDRKHGISSKGSARSKYFSKLNKDKFENYLGRYTRYLSIFSIRSVGVTLQL